MARILLRDMGAVSGCKVGGVAVDVGFEIEVEEAAAVKLGSMLMLRGRGASISFNRPARTSSLRLGISAVAEPGPEGPVSGRPSLDPGCP